MDQQNFDTKKLWRIFFLLINSFFFILILGFMYLVLEDQINAYLDKPTYTKEQLKEFRKQREKYLKEERDNNWDLVERGIHVKTGLKADKNLQLIIGTCTPCHSAKLITQNRATRQGWKNMIVWMQETQGLHDLGTNEPIVLDYLAKHYAPKKEGRRANLDVEAVKWYVLNLEDEDEGE